MNTNIFSYKVRVPYAHVDKMDFVYYANYFVYFEIARTELLREIGFPYKEMENNGMLLPVLEANCRYKRAANYDDELIIKSVPSIKKNIRLRIQYEVKRNDELLAEAYTEHVCMSPGGKVLRLPKEFDVFLKN